MGLSLPEDLQSRAMPRPVASMHASWQGHAWHMQTKGVWHFNMLYTRETPPPSACSPLLPASNAMWRASCHSLSPVITASPWRTLTGGALVNKHSGHWKRSSVVELVSFLVIGTVGIQMIEDPLTGKPVLRPS